MGKIQINPVLRAVGVIGSVTVLVSGVTFAAFQQSSVTLAGNDIASATANLWIDGNDTGTDTSAVSETGFSFAGLAPGGEYGSAEDFRLENVGDVPLDVQVKATSGVAANIDKNLVTVRFTNTSEEPDTGVTYTLAELEFAPRDVPGVSGDTGFLGFTTNTIQKKSFTIEVKLEAGAVTSGSSGSIGDFDLIFTGTNDFEVDPPVAPSAP